MNFFKKGEGMKNIMKSMMAIAAITLLSSCGSDNSTSCCKKSKKIECCKKQKRECCKK